MIQFDRLDSVDKPMDRIEINYRALLAVAVVLNSQRDMHSLWEAITAEITKVIPWARASVTLYDREADGFRFHVFITTIWCRWCCNGMPLFHVLEAVWGGCTIIKLYTSVLT